MDFEAVIGQKVMLVEHKLVVVVLLQLLLLQHSMLYVLLINTH